ncbi:MAG: FGGY family carbohydrate kinase [Bacteroidota bacterium]
MVSIGYDIGSSSVKAALLNCDNNEVLATAQYPKREMSMIAHHPGWAEQRPEDWWDAVKRTTAELLANYDGDTQRINAIGISYQMHGLVCVDAHGDLLRPSIIWCDSRAIPYGQEAYDALGTDYCKDHLLNSPGNFTAAKLAWVKNNEPEIYDRIHRVMLPGDYIAMRFSGQVQTTTSGLSEGVFYDFKREQVSEELMKHFGFQQELIPEVVPTFSEQDIVSYIVARELGLPDGIAISYRAGDQPNNALSLDVLRPGEIAATAGTSGVIYGISDELKGDERSRVNAFAHVNHSADDRRLGILLCINGTGIMYNWANKNLNVGSYSEMNEMAAQVALGSDGLTVLPFGNGAERILENRDIEAHIHGLQLNIHDRSHVVRAITEGIACAMRYGTDIMAEVGVSCTSIKAGFANLYQSAVFRQAIANLTNAKLTLYNTDGAVGAARGAAIGIGWYTTDDAFTGLRPILEVDPDADRDQYEELFTRWRKVLDQTLTLHE